MEGRWTRSHCWGDFLEEAGKGDKLSPFRRGSPEGAHTLSYLFLGPDQSPAFNFLISSASAGTTSKRSPTIP